jgi:hypothetical protein
MAGVRLPGRFVTWNALVASFVASICADFDSTKVVWARNFFFGLSTANCNQQDERKKRKTIAHFRKRQQIEKTLVW